MRVKRTHIRKERKRACFCSRRRTTSSGIFLYAFIFRLLSFFPLASANSRPQSNTRRPLAPRGPTSLRPRGCCSWMVLLLARAGRGSKGPTRHGCGPHRCHPSLGVATDGSPPDAGVGHIALGQSGVATKPPASPALVW